MASSTVIKHFTDGTIKLEDGTGSPIDVTIRFCNGDLSTTGLQQKMQEVAAYETRGTLNSLRHGARIYVPFSFTAQMSEFTSATDNNIPDAILQNGAFAAGVSTRGANADVYTLKLTFTVEGTDFGDSSDPEFTMDDCHCTVDFSEGEPNTFSVAGTCYGTIGGDLAIAGT